MAERKPSTTKSPPVRKKCSRSVTAKPHVQSLPVLNKRKTLTNKGKIRIQIRKYPNVALRSNRSKLANRVPKKKCPPTTTRKKASVESKMSAASLDELLTTISGRSNTTGKLSMLNVSDPVSSSGTNGTAKSSGTCCSPPPQCEIEGRNGEADGNVTSLDLPKTESPQSSGSSRQVDKGTCKSPKDPTPKPQLSESDLEKPHRRSPIFSIEKHLKMRAARNRRTKLEEQSRKNSSRSLMQPPKTTTTTEKNPVGRQEWFGGDLNSSPPKHQTPSGRLFDTKEYMQDVGILAELVKKATLEFFTDAGAIKCALQQEPVLKQESNKTETANQVETQLGHHWSAASSVRHQTHRGNSKNNPSASVQLSSSASDLCLHQVSCNTSARYHVTRNRKFGQSSSMKKEKYALGEKRFRHTRIKHHKLMNDSVAPDNERICTSFNLDSDRHSTLLKSKQNKIEKEITESTHRDSTTSNEDLTGLGAIIAQSRRTALEQQSVRKVRTHYKGSNVATRSISSKQAHCSQSSTTLSTLYIGHGCNGDAGGVFAAARPQNLNMFENNSNLTDRTNYTQSENSKSVTSNKTTQTGKDFVSDIGSVAERPSNLSHSACNEVIISEWDDKSTYTTRSSLKKSKLETSSSQVSQMNDTKTRVVAQDLPTYLDPSDAWAFYNSTKIRLPYMEIDGIFDGTPFASVSNKDSNAKHIDCKAIQVDLQQPVDSLSVKDVEDKSEEEKFDPASLEPLSERALAPVLMTNEEIVEPKNCCPSVTGTETCEMPQNQLRNTSLQEKIGITSEVQQGAGLVKTSSRLSQFSRKSSKLPTKINRRHYSPILTDSDQDIQRLIPHKNPCLSGRRWVAKWAMDNRSSDQSSSDNLPGYARPTTTSCRRYQETQIEIKERKQAEGTPSRYMTIAQKKAMQWTDKRKRVLCSRRRSSILVNKSSSRCLGCGSCRRFPTVSSDTDTSTKSRSSNQNGGSSKKSISFSLQTSANMEGKDSSVLEGELLLVDACGYPEDSERIVGKELEATTSGCSTSQENQSKMPFFKKWLKSVSQMLNPWKKIIMKPDMVNVSCSNTNLIQLPNLLLQSKRTQKKSSLHKLRVFGSKAGIR